MPVKRLKAANSILLASFEYCSKNKLLRKAKILTLRENFYSDCIINKSLLKNTLKRKWNWNYWKGKPHLLLHQIQRENSLPCIQNKYD